MSKLAPLSVDSIQVIIWKVAYRAEYFDELVGEKKLKLTRKNIQLNCTTIRVINCLLNDFSFY